MFAAPAGRRSSSRTLAIEERHPEHVGGGGPEQDYLSRYFFGAPGRHIDVRFNFEPRQVINTMEYYLHLKWKASRIRHPWEVRASVR